MSLANLSPKKSSRPDARWWLALALAAGCARPPSSPPAPMTAAAVTTALVAAPGRGLEVVLTQAATEVSLLACPVDTVEVVGAEGWGCAPVAGHAHPVLATAGDPDGQDDTLHWTRLAGVPRALADGQDEIGVKSILTTGALRSTLATEGQLAIVSVDPAAAAPALHGHPRPACPAGFTSYDFTSQRLCVTWTGATDSWDTAVWYAAGIGARLCSLAELQLACESGYRDAIDAALQNPLGGRAWLRDRVGDNLALMVNSSTCANLDGEKAVTGPNAILHGHFDCITYAADEVVRER